MLAAVEFQADPDTSVTLSPNCKELLVPGDKGLADPHAPLPPPICAPEELKGGKGKEEAKKQGDDGNGEEQEE